jgi:[ribosomal protein S5]-alanine N-acetyltransferase
MNLPIELENGGGQLREWRPRDASSIARYANNRDIWLNLRDGFPHPYSLADAERFIAVALTRRPPALLAIDVAAEAVGSIGVHPHQDVERVSMEMGYWLAEPFWGRGLTTAAARAMVAYAFATFAITRIYAVPYGWNGASARVLEKAGFHLEGRMRRSAIKDGKVVDQLLYAINDTDVGLGRLRAED